MFKVVSPESVGVKSSAIKRFIALLDKRGARTHSFIMLRHGKIFSECYYKPFNKDFCHRMYSQTKSFVGIGICLLIQDGLLDLSDKIYKFFPDKIDNSLDKYYLDQTIEEMLTMTTCLPRQNWFDDKTYDRTKLYFSDNSVKRPSNTLWAYDSGGSQVLCALIERLTGKTLLEYLTEKIFAKTGFFKTARVLKTPNGDSWGDSALICTQRDVASFAQLLLDGGVWQGERLINEDLVKKATSSIVDNNIDSFASPFRFGYGYQIWKTERDGFAFVGMGDQLTIVVPQKDLVFSICSDNQGNPKIRELIFDYFFDIIIDDMLEVPIVEDETSYKDLQIYLSKKELFHLDNSVDFDKESVNNVKYILSDNPMGIKWFKFNFDLGEFLYENAQGQKVISFGVDKNVFSNFPEYGYAKDYGTQVTTDGFTYKCATSVKFADSNKIIMCVQIIDDYFGNMSALFAFKGDEVVLNMSKTAEDFLQTYQGTALGRKEKN